MPSILPGRRTLLGCVAAAALCQLVPAPATGGQRAGGVPSALTTWLERPAAERAIDAPVLARPLDRAAAARALSLLSAARLRTVAEAGRAAIDAKAITLDGRTLRWESRTFGNAPAGSRSLWISLHGGGNAPAAVNDQQWRNQIRLYEPAEGIYLAPRAPTDTWNLWHEPHIDPLFQRLIDYQVAVNGVDPDKVYLLGYSAGGDGVWQLAPRMADRFAAAATMAGHPNEARLEPVRNLPFAIFMGGADAAYDRNRIAAEKSAELAALRRADPGGYVGLSRIYPGLPHWMNRKDAEALPWMAQFRRDPWPKRIVWVQDDVTSDRFYWLQIPPGAKVAAGDRIVATVTGQTIALTGAVPAGTTLRLSDRLLDLDRPVTVTIDGRRAFHGRVPRTARAMWLSLLDRADPASAASALLPLK
ncbi:dienelactone hydrolase family protein [Sphingomonas sp. Leaf4]|uniref:dienelactone hydrolase family protein n=1 Tax=Sphingomonas sp. Leaf4 TaxID=2876553 RepID=UPI001E3FB38A|nr:dienelactone hydrolase family protein [Sphingomonas sp. Leaf4]